MSELLSTNTKRVGFMFIWKVGNFSFLPKLPKDRDILSPLFIADNLEKTSWILRIRPPVSTADQYTAHSSNTMPYSKDMFLFYLFKDSRKGPETISLDYELSIVHKDGTIVKSMMSQAVEFNKDKAWGPPLFINSDEVFRKEEILPDDVLTLQCKMWHHSKQCLEPGVSLARTRIGTVRKTFNCTINDFSNLQVNHQRSTSVELFSNQLPLYLTVALILTGGPTGGEKIQIRIEGRSEKGSISSELGISIQNANGKFVHYSQIEFIAETKHKSWWFPLILKKEELMKRKDLYLPNDVLTLKCDLMVYDFEMNRIGFSAFGSCSKSDLSRIDSNKPLFLGKRKRSSSSLENDLKYLFDEKHLTDINLQVQNEIFPVHKAILAARSLVFKTMFDIDMKEKLANTVEINDIEPDAMRQLLLYIYSEKLNITLENVHNVYLAAEKYAVLGLKERCSSYMMANLGIPNACEILVLADMVNDEELKDFVINFIQDKDKLVLKSNEWSLFSKEHPRLAVDVMTRLYSNVKQF